MSKITIKQIAAEAGVSVGTVDRVLHERGKVSLEKKVRVLDICRQYGYEQNIVGKAMAMRKKQHMVAVMINPKDMNSFSAQIYLGIQAVEAELTDYNITFEYHDLCQGSIDEQMSILRHLESLPLAGLIIKPIDSPLIQLQLNRFAARGIPVVLCTSDLGGVNKLCFVGQNHYRDGRLMANTLSKFASGPLNILMVTGSFRTNARRARVDGFLSYMQEHERPFHICDLCEIPSQQDAARRSILSALDAHPEANALYINITEIEPCLEALESYGRFHGLRFCFGQRKKIGPLLAEGKIDFAIEESPFQHGYRSGEAIFKYLLSQEVLPPKSCLFCGNILLEENSSD